MCGIFGAIGRYNPRVIGMLGVLNETRGRDSCGFYNGRNIYKTLVLPRKILDLHMLTGESPPTPYLMGHTRKASTKEVSFNTAHPFTIGPVTGTHNGVIKNWEKIVDHYHLSKTKMRVDSQVIFWGLAHIGTEFLDHLEGDWSLAWVDKREPDSFYLACDSKPLGVHYGTDVIYYSSERRHLDYLGLGPNIEVQTGEVIKINVRDLSHVNEPERRAIRSYYASEVTPMPPSLILLPSPNTTRKEVDTNG